VIRIADASRVDDMIRRALLLSIVVANAAIAQRSDTTAVCWRARPLAKCKTWIVSETSIEQLLTSSSARRSIAGGGSLESDDFSTQLAFTAGGLKNLDAETAFGFTGSLLMGQPSARIEARFRRWLAPDYGVDVSGGIASGSVRGLDEWKTTGARGVTAAVGISNTWIGADARVDLLRTGDGRTVHASYVGFRAGSQAGPIVAVAGFALLAGLFYLATSGGDY
jgi:hypothetical protein